MHLPSKKYLAGGLILLLIAVIFVCFPHPASDLHLRITFEEFEGDGCSL